MLGDHSPLRLYDLINTDVLKEVRLGIRERDDRAVSSSTHVGEVGPANGIVESQTKGLVGLLAARAVIEEVLLDIIEDGEQRAARRISRGVLAIWASDAAGEGSCSRACE